MAITGLSQSALLKPAFGSETKPERAPWCCRRCSDLSVVASARVLCGLANRLLM